ncbi:MAG TPA: cytochrome c [Terriglobales bacterium]|nr:cytochrome c [Terriglobales bacterium]
MNFKWFVLGIVATLVVLCACAYVYLEHGFVDARADVKAGMMDHWLGSSMDASTSRHAPNVKNPVPDTQETLVAAATTYSSKCGICHGSPAEKDSKLGAAFNPPAPQFFGDDPPDMMGNENYYIIKHGVRMTAMPAWDHLLSDEQIWQTVALLKHINNKDLPPPVTQQLSQPPAPRQ